MVILGSTWIALIMLRGLAILFHAILKAVPWFIEVLLTGSPMVTFIPLLEAYKFDKNVTLIMTYCYNRVKLSLLPPEKQRVGDEGTFHEHSHIPSVMVLKI